MSSGVHGYGKKHKYPLILNDLLIENCHFEIVCKEYDKKIKQEMKIQEKYDTYCKYFVQGPTFYNNRYQGFSFSMNYVAHFPYS